MRINVKVAGFFGALALAALLVAQTSYPTSFSDAWDIAGAVLPTSPTAIYTKTTSLDGFVVANRSGSAITVSLTDNSTNCGGSTCSILEAVSIAANTTYSIPLQGIRASGGVKWSASASAAAHAWIRGRN